MKSFKALSLPLILNFLLLSSLFAQIDWTQATASAAWVARGAHTSVVFDNKIWVIGGVTPAYNNEVWNSTDGVNWTQATASAEWSARGGHTSVVFDNKIWVMGGASDNGRGSDVWYSTDGVTWTEATASPGWAGREGHTSVVFDNKMWVFGGIDGAGARKYDVWYSTDGVTWTRATATAQWSARLWHSSVVFDNKIWVLGGYASLNDVWYSTDGVNWTRACSSAAWSGREAHASVAFQNKMWVLGGSWLGDVWYSTDGANWTQATTSTGWPGRQKHTSVVFNDKIWVIGGDDGGSPFRNDVWYSSGLGIEENKNFSVSRPFLVEKVHPNPFKTDISLVYNLPKSTRARLTIYNSSGQLVKVLFSGFQEAGSHNLRWDGKDATGNRLRSGIYFLDLKVDGLAVAEKKIIKF